ncbi:hypothetical protein ACFO1B_00660 [Dactylosporangium siamense]|uniref:Uncharacterized protein n=1 Tax=Dactylosporangium siamense TaxID=685454 RepID=A0A919PGG5_9ACTN|nr:hypothetical protein [Dactylosporangium siamense]GIG42140.1 hypothetical protein Dsi01nite_001810 [Dactylosporangium siamense]
MTYHLIDEPPAGTITHATLVAFLPGGACAALLGPTLMGDPVLPGESIDLDASVRIPLRQAGFRRQRVRAFALPVAGVAHARSGNEAGSTAWVDRPR